MKTLNTWAAAALAALVIGAAGGLMDGPSDTDAAIATQSATQDAIDSVASSANAEGAEARIDQLFAGVKP
jgi:hypothetical protein